MAVQQVGSVEAFAALVALVSTLVVVRFEMPAQVVVPLVCSAAEIALVTGVSGRGLGSLSAVVCCWHAADGGHRLSGRSTCSVQDAADQDLAQYLVNGIRSQPTRLSRWNACRWGRTVGIAHPILTKRTR